MAFYKENHRGHAQVVIPVELPSNQRETRFSRSYSQTEEEEFMGFKYKKELTS